VEKRKRKKKEKTLQLPAISTPSCSTTGGPPFPTILEYQARILERSLIMTKLASFQGCKDDSR
jgi:hypothetical protein